MRLPETDKTGPRSAKVEAGSETFSPDGAAGHQMYCPKCRAFKVKQITIHENGNGPNLTAKCYTCGNEEKFVYVVGGWMPESLLGTMDSFLAARIEQADAKYMKSSEKVTDESSPSEQDLSVDELDVDLDAPMLDQKTLRKALFTRGERAKAWLTCGRYLKLVMAPVAGLLLMGTLGVLARLGVYVHPIYEWLKPYYQPWMASDSYTIMPIVGAVVLLLGYVACRRVHKNQEELTALSKKIDSDPDTKKQFEMWQRITGSLPEQAENVLAGIDEL